MKTAILRDPHVRSRACGSIDYLNEAWNFFDDLARQGLKNAHWHLVLWLWWLLLAGVVLARGWWTLLTAFPSCLACVALQ